MRPYNVVVVGEVEFKTDEPHDLCLPGGSCDISSPRKSKKIAKVRSPFSYQKKFSLADSPSVSPFKRISLEEYPSFVAVLAKRFEGAGTRISGCDRRAAPVFRTCRERLRLTFCLIIFFCTL